MLRDPGDLPLLIIPQMLLQFTLALFFHPWTGSPLCATGCQLNTCDLDSATGSATFSGHRHRSCVTRRVSAIASRSRQPSDPMSGGLTSGFRKPHQGQAVRVDTRATRVEINVCFNGMRRRKGHKGDQQLRLRSLNDFETLTIPSLGAGD